MPTTRRSRTIAAAPEEVWLVISDPNHLPRWWPRVARVEGVHAGAFTQVLQTDGGKSVRADFRTEQRRAPQLVRWQQDVEGTPFERLFSSASTEIRIADHDAGSRVTIEESVGLRGFSRFGGFMVRRATRRRLDAALDGLAALYAEAEG